ncbi:hypothetical protein G7072_04220 [Nocardioides sp. HDW12B]|uniref:FlgD immunoglobulin-like domain containing protein n=1 Tax=Nocardioides sp. HDW12B TaxID=2714939 RepID=UPI00140DCD39|nr:FlgD immunoglobulin-like domain containing protein [Nocardioides sp. HDW12B]QIK65647.1 hypothetical protein G7072_04220 [Nocardioides sp. HDW12B]
MRNHVATASRVTAVTALLTALVTAVAGLHAGLATAAAAEVRVSLTTSTATFYPPVDGYRDLARFTVRTDRASTLSLQVREDPTSPVVRTVAIGARPAGFHAASWDARDDLGDLVDPGGYVVRAVATRPGRPTQRTAYTSVRMSWRQLAPRASRHVVPATAYRSVRGECGVLRHLATPAGAVRFDMVEPEDCPIGTSGRLEAMYRFRDYPAGFGSPTTVIRPHVTVEARGNDPVGYGALGLETWLDQGDESGWEWYFDPSSGDDGIVRIDTGLRHHQDTERAVRFSFSGSTGDDYVLEDLVIDLDWQVLVPAPAP